MYKSFIEVLEQRQLLTFIAFGREHVVAGTAGAVGADMAVADDGSFWVESAVGTGPNQNTIATRYSAHGELIGKPVRVNSLNEPAFGAIATDPDGDAVIVYERAVDLQQPLDEGIYFRRLSKDGIVSRPVLVRSTRNALSNASVSMDASGGFFIGWVEQDATNTTVYVRSYDAAGAPRSKPIVVKAGDATDFLRAIDVAAKADGSATGYVLLESQEIDSGVVGLAGTSGVTNPGGLNSAVQADIAIGNDGSFVVGYQQHFENNFPQDTSGVVERFDPTGVVRGSPVDLGQGGSDIPVGDVSVDAFPDGGFVTTYRQDVPGSPTVFLARYRSDGTLDTAPIALGSADNIKPAIGTAADGTTVLAWVASDKTVHFRRYTADFAALDAGELYVLGGQSADSISVKSASSTVVVTSGTKERHFDLADVTALTINAFEGGDIINTTLSVPTTIQGGTGSDHINVPKTTAPVLVSAQDGNDTVEIGDNVVATVYGGNGNDTIRGGAGDQFFDGQSGADRIDAGAGDDQVFGGAGDDHLEGSGGNDTLTGGAGRDWLEGGAGNDAFFATDNEHDRLFGDDGNDSAGIDKKLDFVDSVELVGVIST